METILKIKTLSANFTAEKIFSVFVDNSVHADML